MAKARKCLNEYKFLGWIDCFIRPKATKSSVCDRISLEIEAEESSADII